MLFFIFPNLFTTANLFLGFYSIISATRGEFTAAALSIMLAALTDGLDGRIARLTNTQSAFGEEYDSMADLVSFGIAPAVMMFHWALAPYGRYGWVASFFYLTCAALRLARFNVLKQSGEKRYFQGCPSPVAACTAASAVLFYDRMGLVAWKNMFILIVISGLAAAMVSTVRYRSFKDLNFRSQQIFAYVLVVFATGVVYSASPEWVLFPLFVFYLVTAPLGESLRLLRRSFRWIPGTGRS